MSNSKTIRIYDKGHEEIAESFKELKRLPVKIQRFMFFKKYNGRSYNIKEVTEDDDKIVVVSKNKRLRMGSNGIFEYDAQKLGITYKKKGRSSARLVIWNGKRVYDVSFLIKTLLAYLDRDDANHLFDGNFFNGVVNPTKGMLSSIIAGKLKTKEDCVKYYATYSLRGVKIDHALRTDALCSFMQEMNYPWAVSNVLRSASNPNELLEKYSASDTTHTGKLSSFLRNLETSTFNKIHALDLKIDWLNVTEKSLYRYIDKKYELAEGLVKVWIAGARGKFDGPPESKVNSYYGYKFGDPGELLPF